MLLKKEIQTSLLRTALNQEYFDDEQRNKLCSAEIDFFWKKNLSQNVNAETGKKFTILK